MVNIGLPNDDPNYSVRIRFDRRLPDQFTQLVIWFAEQIYTSAQLRRWRDVKLRNVNCILANLVYAAKIDPELHIGAPFSPNEFTQTRYNNGEIGYRPFVAVVRRLRDHDLPFITYHRGIDYPHIGRVGRIRATDRTLRIIFGFGAHIRERAPNGLLDDLNNLIDQFSLVPIDRTIGSIRQEDIIESEREVIVLRNVPGADIDYIDTDETNRLRHDLQQWNRLLSDNFHVDLLLTDDEVLEVFSGLEDRREVEEFFGDLGDPPSVVELNATKLRRIFNHSRFDRGGRFYGGWWQTVPSRFRRRITVNCVPTVEVDYSTLHPAMLYAEEGLHLPGDAYAIDGIDPRHRKLIKKTLLRLINATADQNIERPREHALPEGWTWQNVQQALIEKHQPIARHLRSGAGLRLMRIDSDIAAQVMLNMHFRNRPVLPVHDSFLTYLGSEDVLTQEMLDAYEETTGFEIEVDRERFIENIFPDDGGDEPLNIADQIGIALQEPAYAGYRHRWEAFVRSRPAEWRERFGRGLEALEGL